MGKFKPTVLHVTDGTYRPDRHQNRADALFENEPERLAGLGRDGRQAWEMITSSVPSEILKRADSLELFMLCRWWACWRQNDREYRKSGDKQAYSMAKQASEQWQKLSARFGLAPVTRGRILAESSTGTSTNDELRREYLG